MGNSCIMSLRERKCYRGMCFINQGLNPVSVPNLADRVLKDVVPLGRANDVQVRDKYTIGAELGRGEFGVVYLCTDHETQDSLACKSISKKKLRTAVDVEDVRREVCNSLSFYIDSLFIWFNSYICIISDELFLAHAWVI